MEKGYYGTSTHEAARKAGVSSGLLFHYFGIKVSIYLELINIGITEKFLVLSTYTYPVVTIKGNEKAADKINTV